MFSSGTERKGGGLGEKRAFLIVFAESGEDSLKTGEDLVKAHKTRENAVQSAEKLEVWGNANKCK